MYLSELVRHARVPEAGEPESPHRLAESLRNLARGHTLLCGRRAVTTEGLEVCARVALSTMPVKRRPIAREVAQLRPGEQLPRVEVIDRLEVSRPTTGKRIDLVDTLGIRTTVKISAQGGQTKMIVPDPDFVCPADLPFPSR